MFSKKENKSIIHKVLAKGRRLGKREPWYKSLSLKKFFPNRKKVEKDKAIRKIPKPQPSKKRQAFTQAAALAVLTFIVFRNAMPLLRLPVPAYVASDELNQRLDALFTAINSQEIVSTEKIQSDLRKTVGKGGVDEDTLVYVNSLIEDAKYGSWIPASERLYRFVAPR